MLADAIPDWVVYIVLSPFIPLAWVIDPVLGGVQGVLIAGAWGRVVMSRPRPEARPGFWGSVYLPFWFIPNVAVVIWGIATDPAL